jgi:hypothetical protein
MLSYTDSADANYWEALSEPRRTAELKRGLGRLFGKRVSITDVRSYYWNAGVHFWKAGCDSAKVLPKVMFLKGHLPLYVIGEAYSDFQGWIEGALRTVHKVVPMVAKQYGGAKPALTPLTMKKVKQLHKDGHLIVLLKQKQDKDALVLDVTEWQNRHPGGRGVFAPDAPKKTPFYKDITKQFYQMSSHFNSSGVLVPWVQQMINTCTIGRVHV